MQIIQSPSGLPTLANGIKAFILSFTFSGTVASIGVSLKITDYEKNNSDYKQDSKERSSNTKDYPVNKFYRSDVGARYYLKRR